MMLSLFFAAAAAIHTLMLLLTLRLRGDAAEWIVRLLLLGLVWDNSILALSSIAFEAPWYYNASWLRYLVHVLLLPPLAFAALKLVGRAGIEWATTDPARWTVLIFVTVAVCFGFVTEIADLALVRESLLGHDRYVSVDTMPPIATITTNVVVIGLAAVTWRRAGWPWLLIAAVIIFAVNGASAGKEWSILTGNLAEILFLAAWVSSLLKFRRPDD